MKAPRRCDYEDYEEYDHALGQYEDYCDGLHEEYLMEKHRERD